MSFRQALPDGGAYVPGSVAASELSLPLAHGAYDYAVGSAERNIAA
jgi:hypothetical protein